MENFTWLILTKAKSACEDLYWGHRRLSDLIVKFSTDKCKVERNDHDIVYSVMDSELTITTQKWGLKKMPTEFWDAIKEGKLTLRYFRIAMEGKKQNQNKQKNPSKQT